VAPAQARVHQVQLDHDAPLERVGVQRVHCRDFFPCSRLVLRDGGVRRNLTGISQRPRYPFHWSVEKVRFVDFTGDGIPEIAWQLETAGGTVSSPSLKGVDGWDGAHVSHLFRFANAGKPPRGYAYVVFVTWKIVPGGAGGLPEIETKESLNHRNDANCCPSAYRVTRHRWDGQRIAPVPGSSHIVPSR
jgi:hypothetical protein